MSFMIFLAALATFSSADPRNPKPDWIDSQSLEYSRDRYLTGVGAADDRGAAEDRARGEISKIFSSAVTVDEHLSESESTQGQGAAARNDFSRTIAQSVKTVSQKVLEDVQVVEHWQDGATRVQYALAVLDRAKAKRALGDKLGELDKEAAQWKQQLDSAPEKLARAKAGMKLLTLLKARSGLNGELRVIDAEGKGLESPLDEAKLKPEASKAVAALDVSVELAGEGADEVETALVKGLGTLGIQSRVGAAKDADLAVSGKVATQPMKGDGSQWKWARSTVTVGLKDARTGKVFARFDASDREASADYNEAARRSRVELAKRVADETASAVTAYFENN